MYLCVCVTVYRVCICVCFRFKAFGGRLACRADHGKQQVCVYTFLFARGTSCICVFKRPAGGAYGVCF